MINLFFKIYGYLLTVLNIPYALKGYFDPKTGKEYGACFFAKAALAFKMVRNNLSIISGSNFLEHLTMATKIMNVPRSAEGCIVECGCYKGASTANLSLVARLCGRRLDVFDSFEGLPEPSERDRAHMMTDMEKIATYSKGAWAGSLEEVRANITKYGAINVCGFHKGYFEDTLPGFDKKCAFVFLDVDLRGSLETCVRRLWPLLADGGCLFTHEAGHMEIASLFFDNVWWHENLGSEPPGLLGTFGGLGVFPGSNYLMALGYTVKNPNVLDLEEDPQVGARKDPNASGTSAV